MVVKEDRQKTITLLKKTFAFLLFSFCLSHHLPKYIHRSYIYYSSVIIIIKHYYFFCSITVEIHVLWHNDNKTTTKLICFSRDSDSNSKRQFNFTKKSMIYSGKNLTMIMILVYDNKRVSRFHERIQSDII